MMISIKKIVDKGIVPKDKVKIGFHPKDDRDSILYAHIASLVDNPHFIISIRKLRTTLGLSALLSRKKADAWLKWSVTSKSYMKGTDLDRKKFRLYSRFYLSIDGLLRKHRRPDGFKNVIKYAVLSGRVKKADYKDVSFCVPFPPPEDEFVDMGAELPKVGLIINPETSEAEIIQLYRTKGKKLLKQITAERQVISNRRLEIERHRDWYWDNMSGSSLEKIAHKDGISKQGVKEGIKDYMALLDYEVNLKEPF